MFQIFQRPRQNELETLSPKQKLAQERVQPIFVKIISVASSTYFLRGRTVGGEPFAIDSAAIVKVCPRKPCTGESTIV